MDSDVVETEEKKKRENDTYLLFIQPEFLKSTMRRSRNLYLRPTACLFPKYSQRGLGVTVKANQSLVSVRAGEWSSRMQAR